MKEKNRFYGPCMMLIASCLFATGGTVMKLIPWNSLALNGMRNLIASLVLGIYIVVKKHKLKWNRSVLFGAVCMFGVTTMFVFANKLTTAGNAIVLQYSCPIWILIMMALFFHKKPEKRDVLTIIAALVGILCFFIDSISAGNMTGNVIALVSGIFYAGVFLANSFEDGDGLSAFFIGQLACGILLSPLVTREQSFSPVIWGAVIFLGLFQVGLAYIAFSEATRYTNPVAASLIGAVEPILNPVLVAIFWGEMLTPMSLVGAAIVIAAVLLYNIAKAKADK